MVLQTKLTQMLGITAPIVQGKKGESRWKKVKEAKSCSN